LVFVTKVFCLLTLAAVAAGCQKAASSAASSAATSAHPVASAAASSQPPGASPAATGAPGAPTPPPAPAIRPVPAVLPETVAKVNGDVISKLELEAAVHSVEAREGRPVPPDQRDRVLRGVLDDMVAYRLLRQEARQRQIPVTEADLDARLATMKKQFGTEQAFLQALKSQNMTVEKLRADARSDLMVNKLLQDEVVSKIQVKPSDISAFYEKNPDKFQQPETVRAAHILVIVPQGSDEKTKAAMKARAMEALRAAKAGKDFGALARQYSQDGSAQHGGDLGFFPRGQMVPAFEQVAFALKPGEISDLVETQFGFHIIKSIDMRPGGTVPFAQVAPKIQEFLENQAQSDKGKAYVESLRARGKVEILI
jgi:peptidyl-prolyl cis-trans isomerase C